MCEVPLTAHGTRGQNMFDLVEVVDDAARAKSEEDCVVLFSHHKTASKRRYRRFLFLGVVKICFVFLQRRRRNGGRRLHPASGEEEGGGWMVTVGRERNRESRREGQARCMRVLRSCQFFSYGISEITANGTPQHPL